MTMTPKITLTETPEAHLKQGQLCTLVSNYHIYGQISELSSVSLQNVALAPSST